ncbi:hypothetical protein SAMN05216410_1725 [Sanguibacter gelidistatuariae]|uniref:Uncharacterized protein n=1 Tax=Sanguibacter gelidistatuariae TaxID=1814289 RepID=A0A1G6KZ00_9MICO|nr:hypothetical protein [Sanguibacter gelidistatuariae]SDC36300.1 hypothetical protein SAMN05216410_1725 [Sanguibacter gelidistatuariae]
MSHHPADGLLPRASTRRSRERGAPRPVNYQPLRVTILVAAMALTGCASQTPTPEATATWPQDGPLSKAMGGILGRPDPQEMRTRSAALENEIAACMTEQGFDYIPVDYSSLFDAVDEERFVGQGTAEWAATNGYGIVLVNTQADGEPVPLHTDPNTDYAASLSKAESAAYRAALYGESKGLTEEEVESGESSYDPSTAGCSGIADEKVSGNESAFFNGPEFTVLFRAMNDIYADVKEDPRTMAADAAWADCMADEGYTDFPAPAEAADSLSSASNALFSDVGTPGDYVSPTREQLAEFREQEIALAFADFTCREQVGWQSTWNTVVFELEATFVDDHKAEIDEFVAAYHEARE